MTEILLVQKVAHIHAVFLGRKLVTVSFISFEKYELRMRKKILTFFPFFARKKTSMKKIMTSFLGQNVAYETLVQVAEPWILYSVSVLRYRGSKIKKTSKIAFFQKFLINFLDPAQHGVHICSGLWRICLTSLKSRHMSRNLRKKRHHMGTSQSPSSIKRIVDRIAKGTVGNAET